MGAPNFNAHNKFAVFCDPSEAPLSVWTGSTNWTVTGLCTQANNALFIEDRTIAAAYKTRWAVLRDALNATAKKTTGSTRYQLGSRTLELWFTPTTGQKDLAEGRALIQKARQGVLFLMFNPGPAPQSLLKPILDLVDPKSPQCRPDLYVAGAVNQDPGGKKNPIILVNHGSVMRGPIEIVLPANIKADFRWWVQEILKAPSANAMVHSKVVVLDPFGHDPVVITGSHNLSIAASGKNDENLVVIRNDPPLATAYAITIQAIYKQYRFRQTQVTKNYPGLEDDDTWQRTYMTPRRVQERAFWMQELGPTNG
jgi:phosphatidylserine/phosphatidylglycerophosphate/cardiolipin synthase-like enzyme